MRDVKEQQAAERALCPRDAKMHRIGSPRTTLGWPDSQLLGYLHDRLKDQEADPSFAPPAYGRREALSIPHPSPAEPQAAQAEWGQLTVIIRAAIAACEERIARGVPR
ncbi:hypothetical protein OG937_45355 [Streptomyces sp. NBC_00510]